MQEFAFRRNTVIVTQIKNKLVMSEKLSLLVTLYSCPSESVSSIAHFSATFGLVISAKQLKFYILLSLLLLLLLAISGTQLENHKSSIPYANCM